MAGPSPAIESFIRLSMAAASAMVALRSWNTLLAALDGNEIAALRSDVDLPRARDLLIRVLQHLLPLRQPARNAWNREEHREHVHRELHGLVDEAGVEVDIRIQLALDEVVVFQRDAFQFQSDVQQRIGAGHFEDLIRYSLDDLGSGVVVLIDAVSEPHQLHALAAFDLLDKGGDVLLRSDLRQHADDLFVRPAVP